VRRAHHGTRHAGESKPDSARRSRCSVDSSIYRIEGTRSFPQRVTELPCRRTHRLKHPRPQLCARCPIGSTIEVKVKGAPAKCGGGIDICSTIVDEQHFVPGDPRAISQRRIDLNCWLAVTDVPADDPAVKPFFQLPTGTELARPFAEIVRDTPDLLVRFFCVRQELQQPWPKLVLSQVLVFQRWVTADLSPEISSAREAQARLMVRGRDLQVTSRTTACPNERDQQLSNVVAGSVDNAHPVERQHLCSHFSIFTRRVAKHESGRSGLCRHRAAWRLSSPCCARRCRAFHSSSAPARRLRHGVRRRG